MQKVSIDNELNIYVVNNEKRLGPFSVVEMKTLYQNQKIDADSLVWFAGMEDWAELRHLGSLFEYCRVAGEPSSEDNIDDKIQSPQSRAKKSESYFVSHWQGKLSPAKSFWANTVLPIFVIGLPC